MKELPRFDKIEREVLKLIEKAKAERKANRMNERLKKIALKVFSSKTNSGRIARTALQAFIGLMGGIMIIFAIPELYVWFEGLPLVMQMGGLAGAVTTVSAIQNYAKTVWDWVEEA